ncbi:hypothetical protein MMC12_002564 [Toensbergia leucococca]|nr:hypothetical protein [Toensbergia leucococca]
MSAGKNSKNLSKSMISSHTPDSPASSRKDKSNLWSIAAREDIFARRQNGEEWETICVDYPTRTRHAMQQQYSVMKKQAAVDNDSFTPTRRAPGRRSKRTTRGSWTSVNRAQSSSDEGEGEELDLLDDEDFTEDIDSATIEGEEDDETDPTVEQKRNVSTEIPRPPIPTRSVTEPSTRSNTLKRSLIATFPNLPMALAQQPSPQESRIEKSDISKRSNEAEATDSDSRTSSHQSKRRKYSTEPSETFNIVPPDTSVSNKILQDVFKVPSILLLPEEIEKAAKRVSMMAISYEAEKASRKQTYEGAIKRANRRANEAETSLHDRSQANAAKLKAKDEAHTKQIESHTKQIDALNKEIDALYKEHETATELLKATAAPNPETERTLLRLEAQLIERDARIAAQDNHLKLYDQLRSQIHQEVAQLQELQKRTGDKLENVKTDSQVLGAAIVKLNESVYDVGIHTIKKLAEAVWDGYKAVEANLSGAFEVWAETGEAVKAFSKKFSEVERVGC